MTWRKSDNPPECRSLSLLASRTKYRTALVVSLKVLMTIDSFVSVSSLWEQVRLSQAKDRSPNLSLEGHRVVTTRQSAEDNLHAH